MARSCRRRICEAEGDETFDAPLDMPVGVVRDDFEYGLFSIACYEGDRPVADWILPADFAAGVRKMHRPQPFTTTLAPCRDVLADELCGGHVLPS